MKNAIKLSKYLFISLLTVFVFACDGEDGEDGLDGLNGPTGQVGTTGATGEDGANGEDGEDGNANVFASEWIEPTEDSYTLNNPRLKALTLASNIDSKEENVILVYYDDDIEVTLLPYYQIILGSPYKTLTSKINHASRSLFIRIEKYDSDLTPREYLWDPTGPAYTKGVRFRYVIIPSSNTSGKSVHPDFLKLPYEEVMNYLGLEH